MQKDTPMGKAYLKAVPKLGSSGPGDEPVRVGFGQKPLTREEVFSVYLDSIKNLPFEAKVGALTAVGVGVQVARGLSKGLGSKESLGNVMNPRDVARVSSFQNMYQKGLKQFADYSSKMAPIPSRLIEDIKLSGVQPWDEDYHQTFNKVVNDYASWEIRDAYHNYRLVPTQANKVAFENAVNKFGGPSNILVGEDSVVINPNSKLNNFTRQAQVGMISEEQAALGATRAEGALQLLKQFSGKGLAETEALAAKPTVSGAIQSGLGAVGNAYTNALSFLRGGGGPKITGS